MTDTVYPPCPNNIAGIKYKKMIEALKETFQEEERVKAFLTKFHEIMTKTSYTELHKEYYLQNKEKLNKARIEKAREQRSQSC